MGYGRIPPPWTPSEDLLGRTWHQKANRTICFERKHRRSTKMANLFPQKAMYRATYTTYAGKIPSMPGSSLQGYDNVMQYPHIEASPTNIQLSLSPPVPAVEYVPTANQEYVFYQPSHVQQVLPVYPGLHMQPNYIPHQLQSAPFMVWESPSQNANFITPLSQNGMYQPIHIIDAHEQYIQNEYAGLKTNEYIEAYPRNSQQIQGRHGSNGVYPPGQLESSSVKPPAKKIQELAGNKTTPESQANNFQTSNEPGLTEQKVVQTENVTIKDLAFEFVESFCPHLGNETYCLPPIKRSKHPDKSSKLLVLSMESEKRVLGSFERFFCERKMPVFMLCHYPVSGFMAVYKNQINNSLHREVKNLANTRDTVTLLLLSSQFTLTVVTVSIISGNSDFAYIQAGVMKAITHMKRCRASVSQWLVTLGIRSEVKEVIAFPNLKKAMMQRITKERFFKQSYGTLCTLHVDDLSAPFEEEWSTDVYRERFTEWMKAKVLCNTSSLLTKDDLALLVGALLSPKLSTVEYVKDLTTISPVTNSPLRSESPKGSTENLGQLKLTIDGVTRGFDEFMDDYVSCYYPDVDTKSYRVPPIHFNIQSFHKPEEYIKKHKENLTTKDEESDDEMDEAGFMPQRPANLVWSPYLYSTPNNNSVGINQERVPSPFNIPHDSSQEADVKIDINDLPHANSLPKAKSVKQEPQLSANVFHPKEPSTALVKLAHNDNYQKFDPKLYFLLTTLPVSTPTAGSGKSVGTLASRAKSPTRAGKISKIKVSEKGKSTSEALQLKVLKDVEILAEVMKKDTRADEGENRVISALEIIGQYDEPMFIICGYQYNNYLNKLREEMFSKGETNRPVRAFGQTMRAEHDCLIFHKQYGAIIICIKAIGDNFTDWDASEEQKMESTKKILEKALKQLKREEDMIHHVIRDVCELTCHKLIALPNLMRKNVKAALQKDPKLLEDINKLTKGYGADLLLCQDELSEKNTPIWDLPEGKLFMLKDWWDKVKKALMSDCKGLENRVYRQIIGRYCGLLSTVEVWSPSNPRVEVRSLSEAVNLCSKRFSKLVLLPHQVEVLNSDHKRLFLYGPPGSGKTLLLILKAREWLLAGKTVILLNIRPGSVNGFPYAYGILDRLKKMMTPFNVPINKLIMINVDSLRFQSNDLSQILPTCCVIMDEVTPSAHPIIEHLSCLQVQHIWCAGAFKEDRPVTAHSFHACKMDKILRCPPIVQTILKHTEEDVRLGRPYADIYQVSSFGQPQSKLNLTQSEKSVEIDTVKHNWSTDSSHYDTTGINSRGNSDTNLTEKCIVTVQGNNSDVVSESHNEGAGEVDEYDPDVLNKRLMAKYKPNSQKHNSPRPESSEVTDKVYQFKSEIKNRSSLFDKYELKDRSSPSDKVKDTTEKESNEDQYDPDSVNERLTSKYKPKSQLTSPAVPDVPPNSTAPKNLSHYSTSSVELGLATDGPRPHIIDHSKHLRSLKPLDCEECADDLANFLFSMVKVDGNYDLDHRQQPSKNKYAFKYSSGYSNKAKIIKGGETTIYSNSSMIHTKSTNNSSGHKLGTLFDNKALLWSDVLIVANEVEHDSTFVAELLKRKIPVEVVKGADAHRIETSKERKLFVTTYKEVNGIERSLIVFVPSELPDQHAETKVYDLRDLQLGHCIQRFSEYDRMALWHVASRSLSALVMILP
ncbi:uncharacterized protein LOC131950481 [Physella acuta]|uniref:uncharacterized protein LOC131950481 n=1 Tax=Physella acuta TaxID=109671 RepID=UPI0027DE2351|nr:uncharacterized protein LOC131950481 [Physella acuta]XP_059168651.1 uncharacterized protein LOC131950481 [Physella acuta]XP_059168652.1 uncharacterized protein LOC131950481 [Physella acuta]